MTHTRSPSMESVASLLACTAEEYWNVYEGPYSTDDLAETVTTKVIPSCAEILRATTDHYRLDDLLYSMLRDAPHEAGRRYVAAALQIAYTKGQTTVVSLAQSWMENLFLLMRAISNLAESETKAERETSPTTSNGVIQLVQPAPTASPGLWTQVSEREHHRCAIMKSVLDLNYLLFLEDNRMISEYRRYDPHASRCAADIAHILPFAFNHDPDLGQQEPCYFRDFFQAWTQLDLADLSEEKMNSPANAMLLADVEYLQLTKFRMYFDKRAFPDSPNKYKAVNPDFPYKRPWPFEDPEFPSFAESGIEPPDPSFLNVHASFCKVLVQSGASRYFDSIEPPDDYDLPLVLENEARVAFFKYRLAALALCQH